MARRILLAVVLLAAVIVVVRLAMVAREFDTVVTAASFDAARDNHTELRAFLRRMPKGGDLHTHLSGAVYAERFIAWAAQLHLCADPANTLLSKPECDLPGDVLAADAMHNQKLYDQLVNAFSTRSFVPTVAVPSDHDKFFAAFDKFGAASGSRFVDMTIDQLKQYHSENVQYVEFMASFACWNDRDRFIKAMAEQTDDPGRLAALRANGLDDCVTAKRNDLTASIGKIRSELGCDQQATRPGCADHFPLHRADPAQQLAGRRIPADRHRRRADPRGAAGGRAQPGAVRGQPDRAARLHPPHGDRRIPGEATCRSTLHAGELWLGDVPPPDLTFHIRQAVEIAHARRIGHGVALAFEHDMEGLLAEMRRRPVVVEINLSSNSIILGVRGKNHPLATYLAAGVPVVLSTDDAGVSRINMTNEYFRAVDDQGLGYRTLKAIARNALIHSFLDERQKREELDRFDRSYADFERTQAQGRSTLQNAVTLLKAAVIPF